jgi:hypothetical protein
MHIDAQQIIALAIVTVSAVAVGRRMYGQIAAFWTKDKSAGCSGCDGCGPKPTETKPAATSTPELVQLQMRPPMRIKRQ